MKVNCMKCKHYFITFDQAAPKGCRIYKIKSKQIPSQIVKQANNGSDCLGFEAKNNTVKDGVKNLTDPKYW